MFSKLAALLRRRRIEAEMSEEIRLHLEHRVEENIAEGMRPEEARYAALRKFGGVEQVKELAREQRPGRWLEQAAHDVRFATRSLRLSPGFTTIAILTLALGIGINTSAFSVLNALLLHPLPYPRAAELVRVFKIPSEGEAPANFRDEREQSAGFVQLAAARPTSFNVAAPGQPADHLPGLLVTADFFSLLGVSPALGRTFNAAEERLGSNRVVVLSHATWRERFGADPAVLNRVVRIDGEPVTIIGVMPAAFDDYALWGDVAAWRPLALSDATWEDRDNTYLTVLGRLQPGVSLGQAQSGMDVIAARLGAAYPRFNLGMGLRLVPLARTVQDDTGRQITWLVMALAGFVLLIACANLANLQFARHAARQREQAIRAALGASRGQLIRRALCESLLLAIAGGSAGCLVARWLNDLVAARFVQGGNSDFNLPLDGRVLGFALAVSVITGIAFGLLPAWLGSRTDVSEALKQAGRTVTTGRAQRRVRHALIVGEFALALVLLAGAGFLLRGLQRFTSRDPGWRPQGLLTADLRVSGRSPAARATFFEQLQTRLAALPGVQDVAVASSLPTAGYSVGNSFVIEGRPEPRPTQVPLAAAANVSPGYFATLGIRLLRGRDFTAHDRADAPNVVIINESMARTFWPNEDPIGKRIGSATPFMSNLREIVGVVSDVGWVALINNPFSTNFQMYRPLAQRPWAEAALVLRTRNAPEALAPELRRIVAELDSDQAVFHIGTPQQAMRRGLAGLSGAAWALFAFAVLGVLLAALGIYGVIAGFVTQRTNEIGVRMALGAEVRDVLRLVLGQGLALSGIGVVLGIAGAAGVAQLLVAIVPGLPAAEPITVLALAVFLTAVALLASWLPARRAAKVDPVIALRAE